MNPRCDFYFNKPSPWQAEFKMLRTIALDAGLTEDLKWGHPCYSLEDKNIMLMHGFNEYCAYLFFKGALLKDPNGILVQQTENVQAARQIRFTSTKDIVKLKPTLKKYIREAIELENSGAKVVLKKTSEFKMPDEFKSKLKAMPALQTAFDSLTPGRQRGYLLYFSSAKQAKTREARIEKYVKQILKGKGLED